ncbi:MAG: LuxR C-terminal-related transcriptional regulator, partial [Gammaproteobacteria bacterium]
MVILAAGATLSTKLIPPTKRSGLVERMALTTRIEKALDHRLVLVRAPAGYGKTSVIGQVYSAMAQRGLRVGWISLDESDKDVGHFLTYLVEVGRRAGLVFGHALSTLLGSGASIPSDTLRTLVLNDLASVQGELYIFLDDYHLVSDDEIRELVNAILRAPLSNLRFVIASRTENHLPLSRLRVLGQLYEIDASDLMFTDQEVGEFLEKVCDLALNGAQISRLREETEGWAASLQMAGIAMRGLTDIDQFLDRFTGEHKSIGDFLGDEVLRRQPPELQEFLIATSILKRFRA